MKSTQAEFDFLDFIAARNTALFLFFLLVVVLIPSTLIPENKILAIAIRIILVFNATSLAACTISRFRILKPEVLFFHIGSLIIMAGGLYGSVAGFVATVNIYEGDSTNTVYRWDRQKDEQLDFDIVVKRINRQYYPVEVKIGVFKDGRKFELIQQMTGESFVLGPYTATIEYLDPIGRYAELSLVKENQLIASVTTDTGGPEESATGFDFTLVAFRTPALKRVWVDLSVEQHGKVLATGASEVNHPLRWQGMRFFNTSTDVDNQGRAYAGIQIVKDPGVILVYTGFACLLAGGIVFLCRISRKFLRG